MIDLAKRRAHDDAYWAGYYAHQAQHMREIAGRRYIEALVRAQVRARIGAVESERVRLYPEIRLMPSRAGGGMGS